MKYILAYDLGTGGTKASLFDSSGISKASAFVECETYYPAPNFREQNPNEWWGTVVGSTKELLANSKVSPADIACISVSGHSLGVVPIGKGKLLTDRVPIWSDSRTDQEAQRMFSKINEKEWYMTTGNGFPAPLYAIFKIMWYQANHRELYANTDKFIGTKDYINFKLTGEMVTDFSYASGSGVYDLLKWKYNEDFIEASGIHKSKLPDILPSTAIVGKVTREAAEELGLLSGTPVACGGVDNSCMALGAGCFGEGEAYTSLGTSAWVAVSSSKPIVEYNKKPYVFTHCVPDKFMSATAIFSAGNSFQWCRDVICSDLVQAQRAGGENAYNAMTALASTSCVGANGLFFNPSLAGGSSLDLSPNIRGAFVGLDLAHTRADMIQSVLEGVAMNLRMAMDVLSDHTVLANEMLMVGGGGKSPYWRQLFANIYNKTITEISVGQDAGSLGAAALGAVGSGMWQDFEPLRTVCQVKSKVQIDAQQNEQYEKLLPIFASIAKVQCELGDLIAHYANQA